MTTSDGAASAASAASAATVSPEVLAALAAREAETRERAGGLADQLRGAVEAAAGSNADDEHDPEGATLAFERQQVAALLRQAEDEAVELAAARARVAAGTFGLCEVCGGSIGDERLVARPTARMCVACADGRRATR
ncbi:TraR/DksA family transcriptional regulator [Actinotalea fermentans]|uniref:Zinc finger DksA/TraR C4-type domain-containing protein n=1 Tax=Actinotalea fermentans TaxID=43671 RepID=A0A511Z288_9CELL|nr:TraR/DksA C4-type zinc finger protein [Actinotalea fermentans]KGM16217.1 hypothetical protein N867_02155 [Actinotalea fermentans ATCC 43279 = JCM 9966 = DSM 3133]GEN81570.1 hypothetical protein AFE02nite_33040 [Actinotalea fermentans]